VSDRRHAPQREAPDEAFPRLDGTSMSISDDSSTNAQGPRRPLAQGFVGPFCTGGQLGEEGLVVSRAAEVEKDRSESNARKRIDRGEFFEGPAADVIARHLTLTRFLEFTFDAIE
jgi:hypothetical protein